MAEKGTLLQALPPITKSKLLKPTGGDSASSGNVQKPPAKISLQANDQVAATTTVPSAAPSEADSGGSALPIVLGLVLLVGIAAGVWFYTRKLKVKTAQAAKGPADHAAEPVEPVAPAVEAAPSASPQQAPKVSVARVAPATPVVSTKVSAKKLPAKPKAPTVRPDAPNLPNAPARPGIRPSAPAGDSTPSSDAPMRIKAPAKPKKRF